MLFHNAKFDLAVAMHWFNLPMPSDPLKVHDTLFLAYLNDPRAPSLELKDLASDHLGIAPDEQEELRDWLFANVPGARQAKKSWGKYISRGPGKLVGRYAIGDVDRTLALFDHFMPVISEWDMVEAYQREQRLLPVILDMEREGVPISDRVHDVLAEQQARFDAAEKRILRKVGDIKIGHGPSLYKALCGLNLVDHERVNRTEKGNPMTGRDEVVNWCTDRKMVEDLAVRSRLSKVLGTYLKPWAEAQDAHGRFFPYFNQTRSPEDRGTRTGRLSSNFQQVPREPDEELNLPYLRDLIIPERGHIINARDYSSQEVRILAHYAEGALLEAYKQNPDLDVHQWVRDLIHTLVGLDLKRSPVKQANFLQIYGGGAPALSRNIPCPEDEARRILKAHRRALPEVKELSSELTSMAKAGEFIRTWGGRLYEVEEGFSKSGSWEKLFYKLINVLIQGSAADQTKELMISYYNHPKREGRILLQVHDELLTSTPKRAQKRDMCLLRDLMNDSTKWDVPMRSDGKTGLTWGSAAEYDDAKCLRKRRA
jgi:DNA polymerase-1